MPPAQPSSEQRHRESEPVLNGQQVSALQKQYIEQLVALRKDVDIRKWAVDQACGLAGTAIEHKAAKPVDVVSTAREIHAFLTEGTHEGK